MSTLLRWSLRVLATLSILALIASLAAWWALRGSLPSLDGRVALPGLSAPVAITRDARGVVTIDAANARDAMRALGYVHGQERFFEMDLMRRLAAGELAELFGRRAVEVDATHRRDRLRARVSANLDAALGPQRELAVAYADGVNAGVRALRVRPWPYLLLRAHPRPWRVEDSPLVGYAMYYDLQDASGAREDSLARVRPVLPPALFALLTHPGSTWDAPLHGMPRGDAVLPGASQVDLRAYASRAARLPAVLPRDEKGSNNFAVAGTLTRDGRAILADDMHLGLRAPNIWFRARLRYRDAAAPAGRVDVAGFTLPGMPGVIVGSNGHVAWGFTNSYGDWLDWIRVPGCTRRACPSATAHLERIRVAGAADTRVDVLDSAWGPVDRFDAQGRGYARRWVAHLPGALNLGLLDMAGAASLDDALRVADHAAVPAQNLLIADRNGRIAWRLLGPVPARAPACRPAEDSDGATCPPWSASTAAAPAIVDPPTGRLWTANARVVDGADLARIGDGGYVTAVRARMIRDALFARSTFTERDLLAIQLDDRSLFLQRWWRLLHDAAARSPRGSSLRVIAATRADLEPRAQANAVAYPLARSWREAVITRIRARLLAPAVARLGTRGPWPEIGQAEGVAWPLVTTRPANLLNPRFASWDALFEDAAREVLYPADGARRPRTWGERNTAAICHPLATALPLVGPRLCMPADALDGDTLTPRAVGPAFGASERMVVSPGHEAEGIVHMPGGQSGHPLSPFWGAGHDDWVHGRPTPFLPGPTRDRLELVPAGSHAP